MPIAGLSQFEESEIRELLADDHARTSARLSHLVGDFDGIVEASEMVALDDEHDPEGSTVAFERAQVAALVRQARDHLAQLELALERLHADRYGLCEGCGTAIAAARLMARPVATTCVGCAAASAQTPVPHR